MLGRGSATRGEPRSEGINTHSDLSFDTCRRMFYMYLSHVSCQKGYRVAFQCVKPSQPRPRQPAFQPLLAKGASITRKEKRNKREEEAPPQIRVLTSIHITSDFALFFFL